MHHYCLFIQEVYTGKKVTIQYILYPVITLFCRNITSFLVLDWHTDHGVLHDYIQYNNMYNGSMTNINKK